MSSIIKPNTWPRAFVRLLLVTLAIAPGAHAQLDADGIAAILDDAPRFEGDSARDATRQPAKVLALAGFEPAISVLDLYSGGGYYTEVLSHVVGPSGSVTSHNNNAYFSFAGEEIKARFADGRLNNVERVLAENNELTLEADRYDRITMMLTFHDFYYVDPDNGWPAIDTPALLAEIHRGLKADGKVVITDHYAESGAPRETGNTLHRIDPQVVIEDMQRAGFELEAKADFLRNETDDHTVSVFDPAVRGKTDRFVMTFRKRL